MFLLGLTGGIGMGKSTVADMFASHDIPVFCADKVVHQLYQAGGSAVAPVEAAFPGVTDASGVRRELLSRAVVGNKQRLAALEGIVHPLVAQRRTAFIKEQSQAGQGLILLDIPLLYETAGQDQVDAVAVVSCRADMQAARVLSRPGMEPEKFQAIMAKQVPDEEKRRLADFVIDTGQSLQDTEAAVAELIRTLSKRDSTKAQCLQDS